MTGIISIYYADNVNTFREKVTGVIDKVKSSKKLRLLAVLLLVAAVPLTVFIAQQAQDIRQKANTNQAAMVGTGVFVGVVVFPHSAGPPPLVSAYGPQASLMS